MNSAQILSISDGRLQVVFYQSGVASESGFDGKAVVEAETMREHYSL